jgi:hypothetical protein
MPPRRNRTAQLNAPSRQGENAQAVEMGNPAYQSNSKVGSRQRVDKQMAQFTWRNRSRIGLDQTEIEPHPIVGARGSYNRNNILNVNLPPTQNDGMAAIVQPRNELSVKKKYKSQKAMEGATLRNNWVIYVKLVKNIYSQFVGNYIATKKFPELMADNLLQAMFHAKDINGADCPVPPTHYIVFSNCDIRQKYENVEINVSTSIGNGIKEVNIFDESSPPIDGPPFNGLNGREFLNREFDQIISNGQTNINLIAGAHYWPYRYSDNSENLDVANGITADEWFAGRNARAQPAVANPPAVRGNTPARSIADTAVQSPSLSDFGFSGGLLFNNTPMGDSPMQPLQLSSLNENIQRNQSLTPLLFSPGVFTDFTNALATPQSNKTVVTEVETPEISIHAIQDSLYVINENTVPSTTKSSISKFLNKLEKTPPAEVRTLLSDTVIESAQTIIEELQSIIPPPFQMIAHDITTLNEIRDTLTDTSSGVISVHPDVIATLTELVASVQNKLLTVTVANPESQIVQQEMFVTSPKKLGQVISDIILPSQIKTAGMIELVNKLEENLKKMQIDNKRYLESYDVYHAYWSRVYKQLYDKGNQEIANRIVTPTTTRAMKNMSDVLNPFTPILKRNWTKYKEMPVGARAGAVAERMERKQMPVSRLDFSNEPPSRPVVVDVLHPLMRILTSDEFWAENRKGKFSEKHGELMYFWEKLPPEGQQDVCSKLYMDACLKLSENDARAYFINIRQNTAIHFQIPFGKSCLSKKVETNGNWYAGLGFVNDGLRMKIEQLSFPTNEEFEATITELFLLDDRKECDFFWRRVSDKQIPALYKEIAMRVEDEIRWQNGTWTSKMKKPSQPVERLESPKKPRKDKKRKKKEESPPSSAKKISYITLEELRADKNSPPFAPNSPAVRSPSMIKAPKQYVL